MECYGCLGGKMPSLVEKNENHKIDRRNEQVKLTDKINVDLIAGY